MPIREQLEQLLQTKLVEAGEKEASELEANPLPVINFTLRTFTPLVISSGSLGLQGRDRMATEDHSENS